MEVALRRYDSPHSHTTTKVSILVLLEVALRPQNEINAGHALWGFNPCFIGSCSATLLLPCLLMVKYSFNPCFIGSCSATRASRIYYDSQKRSFNPCFIGSCSATDLFIGMGGVSVKFQSLFYWKLLCDCKFSRSVDSLQTFQSLFYWKLLCDLSHSFTFASTFVFQSLFYWKLLCDFDKCVVWCC